MVLSRKLFVWNANEFCKRFKDKGTALEFVEEWNVWLSESHPSESDTSAIEVPPAKRIHLDDTGSVDEKWMEDIDHEIEMRKVGMY